MLLFNDYLGRFSLFYYCKDNLFISSTEIKTILNFMPEIRINKSSLVEFLMFEFPLGNKTIFSDIVLTLPSQLIVVEKKEDTLSVDVADSAEFNFALTNPFKNEKEVSGILRIHSSKQCRTGWLLLKNTVMELLRI